MSKEELINLIRDNLTIKIDTKTEFGPSEYLVVKLKWDGEEISESSIRLETNK